MRVTAKQGVRAPANLPKIYYKAPVITKKQDGGGKVAALGLCQQGACVKSSGDHRR